MAKRSGKKLSAWQIAVFVALFAFACLLYELFPSETPTAPTSAPEADRLTVYYLDVGQGDATLLCQGEHTMLIDAGPIGGEDVILDWLADLGVQKLDYVLASHAHLDHIGGMEPLIREVEIGTFLLDIPPEEYMPTTRVYENMLLALDERAVHVVDVAPRDTFSLGEAQIEILGPTQAFEDANNQSIVCRIAFGERRFLFQGDAEELAETELLYSAVGLQADVLHVGHHGSSTSSSEAFLRAISPEVALISCGAGNEYGHPHRETLKALQQIEAAVYRTDLLGTVMVSTDGTDLQIESEREG